MMIERRLSDRNADSASRRWVWKLVALALAVTAALYFLLTHPRRN
jgi:hypothetical protein